MYKAHKCCGALAWAQRARSPALITPFLRPHTALWCLQCKVYNTLLWCLCLDYYSVHQGVQYTYYGVHCIRPLLTLVPTDRLHLDYPPQCARQWAWLQNCAHPILVLSSPLLCTNCLPMLSTSTMWDCCGQRWANNVFRTEYDYKQYSDSHFGPNTNTNILSFRKGLNTNTNDIWLRRFCQIIIKMLPELDC